jgi:hypothetical protein
MLNRDRPSPTARTIRGSTSGSGRDGRPGSVNSALIFRCGASDHPVATDHLHQKVRLFQDHKNILEEIEYEVGAAVDSQVFAEFVVALEGRRPEVNAHNIDGLLALRSEFGFEKPLTVLETFDVSLPHAGVSSIEDESRRHGHDVEERNHQFECDVGL